FMFLDFTIKMYSDICSLIIVLISILSSGVVFIVIITMPLFLARVPILPIDSLSLGYRVLVYSFNAIGSHIRCHTDPKLTCILMLTILVLAVTCVHSISDECRMSFTRPR